MNAQEDLAELRRNLKRPCQACGAVGSAVDDPCGFVCIDRASCHKNHFKTGRSGGPPTERKPAGWRSWGRS